MVMVTGIAPAVPAAIVDGVKEQLLFVSVVSLEGVKLQLNVTALLNVAESDVGVAVKLYARVVCPARTVCDVLVVVHVKVGAVTCTTAGVAVVDG
jgi:hypothetical protein